MSFRGHRMIGKEDLQALRASWLVYRDRSNKAKTNLYETKHGYDRQADAYLK